MKIGSTYFFFEENKGYFVFEMASKPKAIEHGALQIIGIHNGDSHKIAATYYTIYPISFISTHKKAILVLLAFKRVARIAWLIIQPFIAFFALLSFWLMCVRENGSFEQRKYWFGEQAAHRMQIDAKKNGHGTK